jgi:ABC-type lipoprotein release transport system permease subunit
VLLLAVAVLATDLPARRVAATAPMEVLRAE